MPKRKTSQPEDDPQLKEEVSDAVDEAADDATTGDVATADEPADTIHLRDNRDDSGVINP